MAKRESGKSRRAKFGRRLAGYSAAAGAALAIGVTGAGAAVIYTPVDYTITQGQSYAIDFNGDGATDMAFLQGPSYLGPGVGVAVAGFYHSGSGYAVFPVTYRNAYPVAKRFGAGAMISTNAFYGMDTFPCPFGILGVDSKTGGGSMVLGDFLGQRGFLGVAFEAGAGAYDFAWVDLEMSPTGDSTTIYGYAWETDGSPIQTGDPVPEPGALALLAVGAAGLAALRRLWPRKEECDGTAA